MIAYLKRRSTFATYDKLDIFSYNIALGSIYDENSTFKAIGDVEANAEDFIVFDDFIGIIDRTTPSTDGNTTEIVCVDIIRAFKRKLVYPVPPATIEEFIKTELEDNYKNIADTEFDMPYLSITSTNATSFISPDLDGGMYSLKSYIAKVRRVKNVFVDFSIDSNILNINIVAATPDAHNIILKDSGHELISQSIAESSIAKITTLQGVTEKDWYLNEDGSITNGVPSPRVLGVWIGLPLSASVTDAEVVADEFAKNSKSHKIVFRSANEYDFYSTVSLRLKDRVLSSYISVVRIDDKDDRYLYKTGELQVTFTDKQKELT